MSEAHLDLSGARILAIDDIPANLDVLRLALEQVGYQVLVATTAERGLELAARTVPDLILLDVVLPGMNGFAMCQRLKNEPELRDIPVIFLTGKSETPEMVRGFQLGAEDYVIKPFQKEEVLARVQTHLERARLIRALAEKNRQLEEEMGRRQALNRRLSHLSRREAEHWGLEGFVGQSRTVQGIFEEIELLRQAPTTSVLITGESGTGKELIARAIHFEGARRDGPFVPVNCSAVPPDLADSLFFGHVRGAFTGADSEQAGYFELAQGGTLFLDEIGDMPPELQPKLLRVLEDSRYRPLGAREEQEADVRVIAATNADLQAGAFRLDLYFRLAQFTVDVPPLRQRREDVQPLTEHFLALLGREMNLSPPPLSADALQVLLAHDFPGNVRELRNILERALLKSRGEEIQPAHLDFVRSGPVSEDSSAQAPQAPLPELPLNLEQALHRAETVVIQRALEQTAGNVAAASRLLETHRSRIYRFLERQAAEGQDE